MDNSNTNIPMSEDPDENLRLENELLRMRLKAELDRDPPKTDDMPPAMANHFLKTALALEHALIKMKKDTIFNILGKPEFIPESKLADEEIEPALLHLTGLLTQKNIRVVFTSKQNSRTRYKFITEEIFDKETDYVDYKGMETIYRYEDFHPDPEGELKANVMMFLSYVLSKLFDEEDANFFAEDVWMPGGATLNRHEVVKKIKTVLDCYTDIEMEGFTFSDCRYVADEKASAGMVEGYIKYKATLESNEVLPVIGAFKVFHMMEGKEWKIKMFDLPGFEV